MNSIPLGPISATAVFPTGFPDVTVVLGLMLAIVVLGMTVWTLARVTRERVPLLCPVRLQPAGVVFRLGLDGRRVDVVGCSVFGDCPITCGRTCLRRARCCRTGLAGAPSRPAC